MASGPYQLGTDEDWLKHSNEELSRLIKRRQRQLRWWRAVCLVLLAGLGWVLFRFLQTHTLGELWRL